MRPKIDRDDGWYMQNRQGGRVVFSQIPNRVSIVRFLCQSYDNSRYATESTPEDVPKAIPKFEEALSRQERQEIARAHFR